MSNRFVYRRGLSPMLVVLAACIAALPAPPANAATKEAQAAGRIETKDFTVVPYLGPRGIPPAARIAAARESVLVGVNQGSESEPNDTFGTADALTGAEGKISGAAFGAPATPGTDPDFYSSKIARACISYISG